MDTIEDSLREPVFSKKKFLFKNSYQNFELNFFQTSIWENDLYTTFCDIFSKILKNSEKIQKFLGDFALTINAEEVLLFNKRSSLFISSYSGKEIKDEKRLEKICLSLKRISNKLKKSDNKFEDMLIKNKMNTIYMSEFNEYCYIVIILSKDNARLELAKLNIDIGKKLFEDNIIKN